MWTLKEISLQKMCSYGNIFPITYLSYIFEFQLVAFLSISWCLFCPHLKYGEGDFFPKNAFNGETKFVEEIYIGIVLHGGTNDPIIPRGKELHKMHFPVICKISQTWWNIHLKIKPWPFYRIMEGLIPEVHS